MKPVGYRLAKFSVRDADTGKVFRPVAIEIILEEEDISIMREWAMCQLRLGDKNRRIADTNFRNGGFFGMARAETFYYLAEHHYMAANLDDFSPADIQKLAHRRLDEIKPNMHIAKNYSPFRILW